MSVAASAVDGRIRIQIIPGRLEKCPEIDSAGIQHPEQNGRAEEGGRLGCNICPARKGMSQPPLI